MLDSDVLELCRDCLLGAILDASDDHDLALAATALSRDLLDTHDADARDVLAAAAREAISVLDESELSASEFAAALSRLAWLRDRAARPLPLPSPVAL